MAITEFLVYFFHSRTDFSCFTQITGEKINIPLGYQGLWVEKVSATPYITSRYLAYLAIGPIFSIAASLFATAVIVALFTAEQNEQLKLFLQLLCFVYVIPVKRSGVSICYFILELI